VKKKDNFWPFRHRSKMAVTWLFATFWHLCVHSVENSTLVSLSTFDQFRFLWFLGVAKNQP